MDAQRYPGLKKCEIGRTSKVDDSCLAARNRTADDDTQRWSHLGTGCQPITGPCRLSVPKTEEPAREDVCRQWDDPGVEVVSYFFHCLSSCAWHELVTLFQNIFSAHVTKCDKQTMFGLTGLKYFHRASVSTFVPPSQSESQIWLLCLSRTEHSASQDNCALYYLPSVYSYSIIN